MTTGERDFDQLLQQLTLWDRRRRLRDSLLTVPRGLLAGLLLAVLAATAARLRPLLHNQQTAILAGILALSGILASSLLLLLQRRSVPQQAQFADRQFRLKERAATAVEIQQGTLAAPADLALAQLSDTLSATARVDTKQGLPMGLNRRDWLMIGLAATLLLMAVLLPNPQSDILQRQQNIAASIEEQIETIEALQEEIENNPELDEAQREALTEPLTQALEGLQQQDLSQEEAMAVLSEAEADLKELGTQLDNSSLKQALQDAGQPLAENGSSQSLGESLQNGALSQAGAAAAQLADDLPQMTPDEQAALAQDLAAAAEALTGVDTQLASELAAAAQALQNGDTAAAQQALQSAAGTLQQRAMEGAAAQQAQSAAGQLSQGRQEVARSSQSGEGQGQGQGEGQGEGQGQGQGEGQGQGQGEGQGQGQGEGLGQGQGQGQGDANGLGQGTGGPGPGGGHAENITVPNYAALEGEGVDIELPAECLANPASCGGLLSETATEFSDQGSTVPYNQVFGDYRNAAYEALADDHIPLGMKSYIRDYFTSLEP